MEKLTRNDLLPLGRYAAERAAFRARAIAHKLRRTLHLGPHMTLLFEDRLTVQYQVQEMLRIERIFEAEGIEEELRAYNPLIPDGANLKATCLIEYADATVRARELARLRDIEHRFHAEVAGHPRVAALADEDLGRSNADKTSSVHFLRFELGAARVAALRAGAALRIGIDDARYPHVAEVAGDLRAALLADFA